MPAAIIILWLIHKNEGKRCNHYYIKHLAFAMRNLNMIIDSPIIISGYLAPYLVPEDLNMLLHLINENNPFTLTADQLLVGTHGQYTPAIGAALHYINRFVHEGTAL